MMKYFISRGLQLNKYGNSGTDEPYGNRYLQQPNHQYSIFKAAVKGTSIGCDTKRCTEAAQLYR